jgi:glutathione S-transferase
VTGLYPVWRLMMARGLHFTPELLAAAPVQIEEALTLVEAELTRRGTPFLSGAQPGPLDIVFSALAGPLVFPPNYGARLPPVDELPAQLKAFVAATRARPAGDLVQRTYDACRYRPDPG